MVERMSRRFFKMAAFAGMAVSSLMSAARAEAAGQFRSILVDTSVLAANGRPTFADTFSRIMEEQANKVFADDLAPGDRRAPVLVIKVSSVELGPDISSSGGNFFTGGGQEDSVEGSGVVVGPGRTVLSNTHLFTHLPPNYAGNRFVDPAVSDASRLEAISYSFAYWLKRQMNGG